MLSPKCPPTTRDRPAPIDARSPLRSAGAPPWIGSKSAYAAWQELSFRRADPGLDAQEEAEQIDYFRRSYKLYFSTEALIYKRYQKGSRCLGTHAMRAAINGSVGCRELRGNLRTAAKGDRSRNANSLPLDRRGRLSRNIVDPSGNSRHLVDDSVRDAIEKIIGQARPPRGHEIDRCHRPQGNHVVIAPAVAHDADRSHRQEHRKGLADLVVEIVRAQFFDENCVRTAQ